MSKYLGPKVKITRRLGSLVSLTKKISKLRENTPGEHGKRIIKYNKIKSSNRQTYQECLIEKQKLKFNYILNDKQLLFYINKLKLKCDNYGINLIRLIELRLDCLVFRLGFASSILAARQLINHGHILVNSKSITFPGYLCKIGDLISFKNFNTNLILLTPFINRYFLNKEEQQELLFELRYKDIYNTESSYLIQQLISNINNVNINNNEDIEEDISKDENLIKLPSHLEIDLNNFSGKLISKPKTKDFLCQVNVSTIFQFFLLKKIRF